MSVIACKKDKNIIHHQYNLCDASNIFKDKVLFNDIAYYIYSPHHIFIIKANGDLFGTGVNDYGQLGLGHCNSICENTYTFVTDNIKAVSVGKFHTAVLKHDKTLWFCGKLLQEGLNEHQGPGYPNLHKLDNPCDSDCKQVVCGYYYIAALYTNGEVWIYKSLNAKFEKIAKDVEKMSSEHYMLYVVDKHRVLWKYNKTFIKEKIADNVCAISSNIRQSVFLTIDGVVWGRELESNEFKFITDNCKQIFITRSNLVVLKTNNEMWVMDIPFDGILNIKGLQIVDTDVLSINNDYPLWSPDLYKYYDPGLKKIIITFLLYNRKLKRLRIPRFVLYEIFQFLVV